MEELGRLSRQQFFYGRGDPFWDPQKLAKLPCSFRCPGTGIAHLSHVTSSPSRCNFYPGSLSIQAPLTFLGVPPWVLQGSLGLIQSLQSVSDGVKFTFNLSCTLGDPIRRMRLRCAVLALLCVTVHHHSYLTRLSGLLLLSLAGCLTLVNTSQSLEMWCTASPFSVRHFHAYISFSHDCAKSKFKHSFTPLYTQAYWAYDVWNVFLSYKTVLKTPRLSTRRNVI